MNEMTCREFDEFVHGFVRMELLDVKLREAALEHAATCSLCSNRMAEATALADATETAGGIVQDQQTPPRVEAAVLAAFRRHHRRAAWLRTFEWATLGAAAAVLLLFVWTANSRSKGQFKPSPSRDVSSKSQGPLDAKVSASPSPSSAQDEPDDSMQRAEVEIADTSTSDAFVASDFVPVPFTAGIASDDPGMVVRVQLTRASLSELGYPIAQTPDEDLILADVLVDQDGWPRGVKLVQ
jgi:hypothetical protein